MINDYLETQMMSAWHVAPCAPLVTPHVNPHAFRVDDSVLFAQVSDHFANDNREMKEEPGDEHPTLKSKQPICVLAAPVL